MEDDEVKMEGRLPRIAHGQLIQMASIVETPFVADIAVYSCLPTN